MRLRVGGQALRQWQDAGVDDLPADQLVGHHVDTYDDGAGTLYRHRVDVPDGLADLPRIGVLFTLPSRFDRMRWYGRGPHENYPDRKASALLATWESPLDELPYSCPRSSGCAPTAGGSS